jgi:hypothetical protein
LFGLEKKKKATAGLSQARMSSPMVFEQHVRRYPMAKLWLPNGVLIFTTLPPFLNSTCDKDMSCFTSVTVSLFPFFFPPFSSVSEPTPAYF